MRLLFSLFISLGITIGIFFGMHLMTSTKNDTLKEFTKTRHLVYLREKEDTTIERKKESNLKSLLRNLLLKRLI